VPTPEDILAQIRELLAQLPSGPSAPPGHCTGRETRATPKSSATNATRPESTVDAAAAYIDANPGAPGKAVSAAVGVSHEHYRRSIVPRLKARGYVVWRGIGGVYPPQE
jgi:hypothetical protein